MNLLSEPWIPVRADGGMGSFRLLTFKELLSEDGDWWVSIPRDDLEMACIQLLVCMVQTMFMPENDATLRERLRQPLSPREVDDGAKSCRDWFDLDHQTQPFMQTRGVKGVETTLQKLLPGMPEKTSTSESAHCFFNETSEVEFICGPIAAIALFNQASNSPSFGGGKKGGFKGSLRGNAPITTLVKGRNLRETIWRNIVTLPRVLDRLPVYSYDLSKDRPTWVDPIREKQVIHAHEIGLVRGLLWQPARVELVKAPEQKPCDVLGDISGVAYSGFRKEQFGFTVKELWPHLHGARAWYKNKKEWKFVSFARTVPAWTLLAEFVVPSPLDIHPSDGDTPAAPVNQAAEVFPDEALHLIVGGYRADQASVVERRHELVSLAQGWAADRRRLIDLISIGRDVLAALTKGLLSASQNYEDKKRGIRFKGLGAAHKKGTRWVGLHDLGEISFYALTEAFFYETLRERLTFKEWQRAKEEFTAKLTAVCFQLFEQLTAPYAMKPEFIPIIAWSRRNLNSDLRKLVGGGSKQ